VRSADQGDEGQAGPDPVINFTDPERRARLASGFAAVDQVFAEARERHRIPGLAYGVVVDGELAHSGGIGVRQVGDSAAPRADTVFRIASMTKSITGVCAMMLRDDGLLVLDDPVSKYVPQLQGLRPPTRDSAPVTVRQLLTMSAGFVEDDPWADRHLSMSESEFSTRLEGGIPFDWAPGLVFEYSNLGYGVVGRVVREVAGKSAMDLATERLFRPLGMSDSVWEVSAVPTERMAHGYRLEGGDWVDEPPLASGAFAPMGGLWTTITDFARYVAFQLAAWPARDDPEGGPLRRSSAREMQQPVRLLPAPNAKSPALKSAGYGYGLIAGEHSRDGQVVFHSGGLPGFGSHVHWLPDHGIGIMAFANLTYAPMRAVVNEAVDALAATGGLIARRPQPSPALVAAGAKIVALYESWDDAVLEELAADNLFLDRPVEQRRREFAELRTKHGRAVELAELVSFGAMRGSWRLRCESGNLAATIWLAPTTPPRIQVLSLTPEPANGEDSEP
jgi:CubicO group peptidase (beta-lactamase class C family)